jgi:hypothetical protein
MTRDNRTDATASHPDHDGLRAQHLDHWSCMFCDLSDDDLARMTDRAYREAARCWAETRKRPADFGALDPVSVRTLGAMLYDAAQSADEWYDTLRAEQRRRQG